MRSAITLSLVPQAKGGPFVFWDGLESACDSASALGFDAIEIFPPAADAIDRPALHNLLARHSLRVAAFGTGGGWVLHQWHLLHGDPATRKSAREFIRQIIELAAEFGAPAIIGSMQGRVEADLPRSQPGYFTVFCLCRLTGCWGRFVALGEGLGAFFGR